MLQRKRETKNTEAEEHKTIGKKKEIKVKHLLHKISLGNSKGGHKHPHLCCRFEPQSFFVPSFRLPVREA